MRRKRERERQRAGEGRDGWVAGGGGDERETSFSTIFSYTIMHSML